MTHAEPLPERVRRAAEAVAERAQLVRIDEEALDRPRRHVDIEVAPRHPWGR